MKCRSWIVVALLLSIALTPVMGRCVTETTPYSLDEQNLHISRREDAGQAPLFCHSRGAKGISASDKWLWQAKIQGCLLNLRLFAADGEGRLFQEQLEIMTPGTSDLRLYLRTRTEEGGLHMQVDQHALDILSNYGIREIVVIERGYYIQNRYSVDELNAMRQYLELKDKEQLCVAGDDDPLSVVSETGYRRMLTL